MRGRRLEKTGGVFAGIRRGFFRAENDADARRSFAAVEWHYSDRLLGFSHLSLDLDLAQFNLNPLVTLAGNRFKPGAIDDLHHTVLIIDGTLLDKLIQ